MMSSTKKAVNRDFPNYSKWIPNFEVVVPAERGDNRATRRSHIASARKALRTPYFLSAGHLRSKMARARKVALKVAASRARREARERLIKK